MLTRARFVLLTLTLIALIALPTGFVTAAPAAAPAAPTAFDATLARLKSYAGGDVQVSIKRGTGVASFVMLPEQPTAESAAVLGDAESRARGFLAQYGALFGIADQAAELATREVTTDAAGNAHVAFRQTHRGLAVFGGDLRVHMNAAGRVTSAGGAFIPGVNMAVRAALTQAQAEAAAVAAVQAAHPDASGPAGNTFNSDVCRDLSNFRAWQAANCRERGPGSDEKGEACEAGELTHGFTHMEEGRGPRGLRCPEDECRHKRDAESDGGHLKRPSGQPRGEAFRPGLEGGEHDQKRETEQDRAGGHDPPVLRGGETEDQAKSEREGHGESDSRKPHGCFGSLC